MISRALVSSQEVAEPEQELLAIAIAAASIRTLLDQPLCAAEHAHLAIELEHVEQVRRALEQHVIALERPRPSWWRRLLRA